MIILQANYKMLDKDISNKEKEMSKKIGRKVVIIPYGLSYVDSCIEGGVVNVFNSLDSTDSKCSITTN